MEYRGSEMLHENTGQNNRPDDMGIGADAGSGQWTGKKRPRHLRLSLRRVSGEVRTSSSYYPAHGDQEDPLNRIPETDLEIVWDDSAISPEKIISIKKALKNKNCYCYHTRRILDEQQQRHVYERLAIYRLRAHKLVTGESDKLDDDTLKEELPRSFGTVPIFRLHIDVRSYFEYLKKGENGSVVDWYFDPELSKLKDPTDYDRLVLTNHNGVEYFNWEDYRLNFTTYELDKDYVTYCDEMSEKLKRLNDYIGKQGSDEWTKMEIRGFDLALVMATKYPNMTLDLAYTAYREHIWSLNHDYRFREEWDNIFFKIWKLITKKKMMFPDALKVVSDMPLASRHEVSIKIALDNSIWHELESDFDSCVKGIHDEASDEDALDHIRKAVLKLPKMKSLYQYKKRKMEVAEKIGLIKDGNRPRVLAKGSI